MRVARLFVISALTVITACGSDSPTGPSSRAPVDLNAILAQLANGGLSGSAAANTGVFPAAGLVSSASSTACAYSASVGGFVCPAVTGGGLTVTTTYYLLNAAGQSQTALDPNTTAAIRSVIDLRDSVRSSTDSLTGTVVLTLHSDMTMSGLLSDTRIVNGTARTHSDINLTQPDAIRGTTDATSTTTNLTVPAQPDPAKPWPTAGTIATDATTTASALGIASAAVTTRTVITFNGSSIVTMTIALRGTTSTCRVDLSGKTPPACS
jgi:hypothetical protein